MLASWIVYASLVSIVLSIAGFALERLASAQRWPRRWIWMGTLVASVAWPLVTISLPTRTQPSDADHAQPRAIALPFTITIGVAEPTVSTNAPAASASTGPSVNATLAIAWIALSGFFLARLGLSILALRRRARTWDRGTVDGVAVRLSSSDGPAVVNLRSMEIVLPRWILSLDAPLRALVLRHEREHRNARDPYLLFMASLLVALVPWNLALWCVARRLRLAIEVDCDTPCSARASIARAIRPALAHRRTATIHGIRGIRDHAFRTHHTPRAENSGYAIHSSRRTPDQSRCIARRDRLHRLGVRLSAGVRAGIDLVE